jgi:hypothetical protein
MLSFIKDNLDLDITELFNVHPGMLLLTENTSLFRVRDGRFQEIQKFQKYFRLKWLDEI